MKRNKFEKIGILVLFIIIIFADLYTQNENKINEDNYVDDNQISYETSSIPVYSGNINVVLNNNKPDFSENDMQVDEYYSDLKNGRVGMAIIKTNWNKANKDKIKDDYSSITPSGFIQRKYDSNLIPGGYLYHRCHLIGWGIGGVDVDQRNLMTGTREFNIEGMKPFEDEVYNYLKFNKSNNVLYRVTPYFEKDNKLATGVNIEAYSIEDKGFLHFNVFVYNVQDGINIDYATGESELAK